MMPIAMIVVLLICLVSPAAAIAQDTTASTNVAKEDSHFLIFELKDRPPYSDEVKWLKQNHAAFGHADYCTLFRSFQPRSPRGSGVFGLARFLVLRDVDEFDHARRTFHDKDSGLDIEVSFEFSPATPPDPLHPPLVSMSLSVHRGKDDAQGDIERSEVEFIRGKKWINGLKLTKLALVGNMYYSYSLSCSDPQEMLTFDERSSKVRHKR